MESYSSRRVPEILQELHKLLQQIKEQLQDLPNAPSNDPVLELMHLINDFSDALYRQSDGLSQETFHDVGGECVARSHQFGAMRAAQEQFRMAIRATAPQFRPFAQSAAFQGSFSEPDFLAPEDGEILSPEHGPHPPLHLDEVVGKVQECVNFYRLCFKANYVISITSQSYDAGATGVFPLPCRPRLNFSLHG
jgi:hypothetical protein